MIFLHNSMHVLLFTMQTARVSELAGLNSLGSLHKTKLYTLTLSLCYEILERAKLWKLSFMILFQIGLLGLVLPWSDKCGYSWQWRCYSCKGSHCTWSAETVKSSDKMKSYFWNCEISFILLTLLSFSRFGDELVRCKSHNCKFAAPLESLGKLKNFYLPNVE